MRGIISRDFRRYDETGAVGEVAGVVARPDTAPPDTSGRRGDTSGQRARETHDPRQRGDGPRLRVAGRGPDRRGMTRETRTVKVEDGAVSHLGDARGSSGSPA